MKRGAQIAAVTSVAAACSLFTDLSGLEAPKDAASDVADVSAPDAGDAGDAGQTACDPSKPFTSIAPIAELDDAFDEYKATLTPDELEIWYGHSYAVDGGSVQQIMHASRASVTAGFAAIAVEANISPGTVDPGVTDDGLSLYYAKFGTVGGWDLFQAMRSNRTVSFGPGTQLPMTVQSSGSDTAPFVAFDGSLYFSSERAGGNHVFVSALVDGGLTTPTLVSSLSSSGSSSDWGAVLTHDGLWAYVSSNRTDLPNHGGYDVFVAHRSSTADGFGPLTNATELNTASQERADWISWDDCRLYFESSRNGTTDLFMASRTP